MARDWNPEGPRDGEQLIEIWEFTVLQEDMKTQEPVSVKVYGDEEGVITNLVIQTKNGLKHYGTRYSV